MSSPDLLLATLRTQLRAAGITYKQLAPLIGMSESSVKRIFSQRDMSLTRLAEICKAADISFEELLRTAADAAPHADTLTLAQEKALVADAKLMMIAICCLGQWTLEQMLETYTLSEPECIRYLVKLDKLGLIELRPLNRYRLRVARTFRWRPDGPVQEFFRSAVVADYFGGTFDGPGEILLCLQGWLSHVSAQDLTNRIRTLAAELAASHQQDQRLPRDQRDGYTFVVGLRSWELSAFTSMRRPVIVNAAQAGKRRGAAAKE
ncbi:MAG: helix-turn-helix domain-containing protein [Burkholderiaceae bacterium]